MKRLPWVAALIVLGLGHVRAQVEETATVVYDSTSSNLRYFGLHAKATTTNGHPGIEIDTTGESDSSWNVFLSLPSDLFKSDHNYTITVEYDTERLSNSRAFCYLLARLANGAQERDQFHYWSNFPSSHGRVSMSVAAADYVPDGLTLQAGIHGSAKLLVRSVRVTEASLFKRQPVNQPFSQTAKAASPVISNPFEVIVDPPAPAKEQVVLLSDYGLIADKPGNKSATNNLAAFQKAIDHCREVHASMLKAFPGIYHIPAGSSIVFRDLQDFTFDGNGATFVFSDVNDGPGFRISRCERALFKNFKVDWDWNTQPIAYLVQATTVSSAEGSVEFLFPQEKDVDINKIKWRSFNPTDSNGIVANGREVGPISPLRVDKVSSNRLMVFFNEAMEFEKGQYYCLRNFLYDKNAFLIRDNSNLAVHDVSIFSFPGEGFILGGDENHTEFVHCQITRPAGSNRPISTASDGMHITQSQGYLRVEDCDFGYMGDDCINIKDNTSFGVERKDDHTITCEQAPPDFHVGDHIELRNPDLSPLGFFAVATDVTYQETDRKVTLTFAETLPAVIPQGAIVFNRRYDSSHFIFRKNYFHENRARGLLVQASDGVIENNRFFRNQHAAMHVEIGVGPYWCEGFGVSNLIISQNSFESSNAMNRDQGAVIYIGSYLPSGRTSFPIFTDIKIDTNQFARSSPTVAFISSCCRVNFNGNTILDGAADIVAEETSDLIINGNRWIGSQRMPVFLFDPTSVDRVELGDNSVSSER